STRNEVAAGAHIRRILAKCPQLKKVLPGEYAAALCGHLIACPLCRFSSRFSGFFRLQLQALVFLAETCQGFTLKAPLYSVDFRRYEGDQARVLAHEIETPICACLIDALHEVTM